MTGGADAFGKACVTTERNLLVIAPPGCGKTELLALRAELLIKSLSQGQKILALTFSNKAKANLNARLRAVLGSHRKRQFIQVHNFHGHAAEIVRSHGGTLEISTDFAMPTKRTQRDALSACLEERGETAGYEEVRQIDDELREAKRGPWNGRQVLKHLRASGNSKALAVEEFRRNEGVVFYDDLLRQAQRLLRVGEVARLYHAHYGAVLVDEFQDLSSQQLDIALRSCESSRTFVGDPLQGIYSWAGARPTQVERVLRRICGDASGLGLSYRSSPRVLELVGVVAERLGGQVLNSHDPEAWFEGGITAGVTLGTAAEEATFIRETCVSIMAKQSSATVGVICRNGWRRKAIDAEFAGTATPCTRWDLAVDDANVVALLEHGLTRLGGNPGLQELESEVLASLDPTDVDTASDVVEAIDQLSDLVTQAGSIGSALAQVRIRDDHSEAIAPGIHLLNAHTGKGQQFDWVFIPGFENGNVPSFLAKTQAQLEEEQRVLMVMLSRARHGIVLTKSQTLVSKAGRVYRPDPSPWIGHLRPALVTDSTGLVAHIERLPRHDG